MKVLVGWSAGKDSEAALIWAKKRYGAKNITAAFCDVKWEHEDTYKHVVEVPKKLGVELVVLTSNKYNGMVELSKKKKRFPSVMARFCTEELKTIPMIDYILSLQQHVIVIQGIRADESDSRGLMSKQCRYFKYYFEPYKVSGRFDSVLKYNNESIKSVSKKGVLSLLNRLKKKYKVRLTDPFFFDQLKLINELPENRIKHFHTYRKREVIEFCSKYADDVERPCFNWTAIETINYVLNNGFTLNPLYYKGAKRVGCYPCIMCGKEEVKNIIENDPEHIDKIRIAEQETGSTFFAPDYIPARYHSGRDKNGKTFAFIDDVVKYVTDKNAQKDLFEEIEKEKNQDRRCMSFYGICE